MRSLRGSAGKTIKQSCPRHRRHDQILRAAPIISKYTEKTNARAVFSPCKWDVPQRNAACRKRKAKNANCGCLCGSRFLVMFLVVIRPKPRSSALSSRVSHRQAGQPFLLAHEQGRSSAARSTDAQDANASSLSRVETVASEGWNALVIASPSKRETNPSCSIQRVSEWPLLLRTPLLGRLCSDATPPVVNALICKTIKQRVDAVRP